MTSKALSIAVGVLLYNRPAHSIHVLESLVQNGIRHCYAFMDRPANRRVKRNQRYILDYIESQTDLKVQLLRSASHLGLARSVVSALNKLFQDHDGVILLEDDCVMRPGGIRFFEEGLTSLVNNQSVRSLCGYLYPGCDLDWGNNENLAMLMRFCTWGWATWADRWAAYEPNLRKIMSRVDKAGLVVEDYALDLSLLCRQDSYLNGEQDIWSINWILEHFLTRTYAVYPRETVIDNIGFDGSGQNCIRTEAFKQDEHMNQWIIRDWDNLSYIPSNEIVVREFMAKNGLKTYPV